MPLTRLSLAIALGLSQVALAAPVPNGNRFVLSGVTRNSLPFTGTVDVQLQYFDAASGGNATSALVTIEDLIVTAGQSNTFVADFGAVNPIGNQDTWFGGGLRLGSSSGAFSAFSARGQFIPGAFALHAQKIAPGIVGLNEVLPDQVQLRVQQSCPDGQAIRSVGGDGSVLCQALAGTGGGDITAVTAGTGLSGGGSTGDVSLQIANSGVGSAQIAPGAVGSTQVLDGSIGNSDVNTAQIQRRVTQSCPDGQAIRVIAVDGSVTCLPGAVGGWQLNGNPGVGASSFLGTTDNVALELRTNARRSARFEKLDDPNGGAYGGAVQTIVSTLGDASNVASAAGASVLGGGNSDFANRATGKYATTVGGAGNLAAGSFSLTAGRSAEAQHTGSFVWADASTSSIFGSTAPNQFVARASGGFFFSTGTTVNFPANSLIGTSTGASLSNGGVWTNASSRSLKTDFASVDPAAVLDRVVELPILTWRYIASNEGRHIGPMAEAFATAFQLGGNDKAIGTVDADGVALAAIQGLNAKLEAENAALRARLEKIEAQLARWNEGEAR